MHRLITLIGCVVVLLLGFYLPSATATNLEMAPCHLKGFAEQVECGYLSVPENYAEPNGKTIAIHVVRLPAVATAADKDPLLFLAGGPGQAATEIVGGIARIFRDVRQTRDLLFIDQRGTGKSNPLDCEVTDLNTLWDALVLEDNELDISTEIAACAAKHKVNYQHYSTLNAVRDFDAVREALGYAQVNLYGGSYGTRSGLAYMREFPASIRVAVLDGVAPPQVKLGLFSQSANAAFQRMLADCAAQEACHNTFPNLAEQYSQLIERLGKQSELVTVPDPRSHRPTDVRITVNRINQMIFPALYSPRSRQLLPFVISEAAAGNYLPIAGLSGPVDRESAIYIGLHLSVICQEDVHRIVAADFEQESAGQYMGSTMMENFIAMCVEWPVMPSETPVWEPVSSDIPTLLLSGEQDPVTPPAWAELAAATLSNVTHAVAAAGGHTIASHTCANEIATQFIRNPSATVDTSCLAETKVLPFLLNINARGM
ncbi:alpha/beta hydrolase [Aliidiomarina quisquiliarum]|uniref:alpha/beta hydrolase n=1 Tax=Aliidiomarina quisquiliarum TaxID=2938947 RepID=UPI00208E4A53|nr:alpha/beta hydrolase [Aliidiomarina quisquiliarum]MCO4321528.1 alpha/beta hydrolase [Aliidiomarina quisquiliarum]